MVRKTKKTVPQKKNTSQVGIQKGKKVSVKAKSAKVSPKQKTVVTVKETPVVKTERPISYKKLFWLCVFLLALEALGSVFILCEYQLVPREAVILNIKKGQKTMPLDEAATSGKVRKGGVRHPRKLSPEEVQVILDEQREAMKIRKVQEAQRAHQAQVAPQSKTDIKPIEKK